MNANSGLQVSNLVANGLAAANFGVAAGEVVPVIGPSGSGKSLLLRAVADLDPSSGDISLNGAHRDEMEAPKWRKRVSYISAVPGWWAETVGDHIAPEHRDRFVGLLSDLGLEAKIMASPVDQLSTGEAQRISIARALVQNPEVLLLDEPTGPLDGASTGLFEAVLAARLKDGVSVLIATHDLDLAKRLSRRCLKVEAGGKVSEAAL